MEKQATLEIIFGSLLEGKLPRKQIIELCHRLEPTDTGWLMEYVERLTGPELYSVDIDEFDDDDNAKSAVVVQGFFNFIDLVSGLIIKLGEEAIRETRSFENSTAPYVPWVIKYCTDRRFVENISATYPFLDL